ncbi:hypothetical protein R1flu_012303 [Riccia fluitans]|uniref:Uncharacterized protein n=1 Tax=Riccia fluitans TaxID=41844 RepID=A0ABD1ZAK0_9MARC
MTKETIDLSHREVQEAKREEETNYATSQPPETDVIDNVKKSLAYGEEVVVPILLLLEESRAEVEKEVGRRMSLVEIVSHFSKRKWKEEKDKIRMEARNAILDKIQAKIEVERMTLKCEELQSECWTKDDT